MVANEVQATLHLSDHLGDELPPSPPPQTNPAHLLTSGRGMPCVPQCQGPRPASAGRLLSAACGSNCCRQGWAGSAPTCRLLPAPIPKSQRVSHSPSPSQTTAPIPPVPFMHDCDVLLQTGLNPIFEALQDHQMKVPRPWHASPSAPPHTFIQRGSAGSLPGAKSLCKGALSSLAGNLEGSEGSKGNLCCQNQSRGN